MYEIKVFEAPLLSTIEAEVNKWLQSMEENIEIEIVEVALSYNRCGDERGAAVLVTYKREEGM